MELNLTIRATYRIDGLRDAGTGLSSYRNWAYHGIVGGMHTFTGSTADPVWVDPGRLTRIGRQHLTVEPCR